jgi:osmoprotectant transport system substrate-binding protein
MRGTTARRCAKVAVLAALAAMATACGGGGGSIADDYDLAERQLSERGGGNTTRLVVGSKDFDEQEILGQITLIALREAGAEVIDNVGAGGTEAVRSALVTGQIDIYWEYTGTGALILLAQSDPPADPEELYDSVAEQDRQRNGVAWLEPAPADNTYALAVREEVSDEDSDGYDEELAAVTGISDLERLIQESPEKATICVGPEFSERADGLPGLEEHYGFEFSQANVFVLPDSTVYGAVDEGGKCNFGSVFNTSGYVPELDLTLLEDDEDFFVAYNPAPTMRAETLEGLPDLEPLLADIASRLDTETLRDLSAEVLVDGRAHEDVAEDWLQDEGLVD